MNNPVIPSAPVNNTITVQPLTTAVPQQGTSAAPNPLANLANGTTVEGFVVNRDGQNNPILRTAVGDVVVTSDVFLKTGSEVIFRVDASQTTRARIVTVDGLSLQDYSTQNTRGTSEDSIATPTLRGITTPQNAAPTAGSGGLLPTQPLLQAVVLQPLVALLANAQKSVIAMPSEHDVVPFALTNLPSGTPLKLVVVDIELPPIPVAISTIPEPTLPEILLPPKPAAKEAESKIPSAAMEPSPNAANPQTTLTKPMANIPASPAPAEQNFQTTAATENVVVPKDAAINQPLPNNALQSAAVKAETASPQPTQSAAPLPTSDASPHVEISLPVSAAPATSPRANMQPLPSHGTTTAAPNMASAPTANSTIAPVPFGRDILHASVIGHEADGANILHTKFATLKLYTPQPLPTGTTLTVHAEVTEQTNATALTPLSDEMETITSLTRDWQHLGDALNNLQTQDAALAREILQQIPTLGPKLTSGLLFFISAVKGGDTSDWLGKNTISRLKFVSPDLLKRLNSDMSQMQQFFVNSPLNQWSGIMLPMMFGNELQQARLYIRKDDENNKTTGPTDRGQRFIIEVDMSHLGDLQFDGFIRSFDKSKAFDLVIRSSKPLNHEVSQGIRDVFENALQVAGLKGQLGFQQGAQHFVRPLADQQPGNSGDSSHTILA